MMHFIEHFQRTYIINLAERADRRREVDAELAQAGLRVDAQRIRYFRAQRPADAGDFPSLGARGCFMSHLGILKEALRDGLDTVLILEDDVSLDVRAATPPAAMLRRLLDHPWHFAYLGHVEALPDPGLPQWRETRAPLATTHCYALHGSVLQALHDHLEACLQRPSGHPLGSPMHVDGAYSLFRRQHPELITLLAVPSLGNQRSSRSDIYPNQWYDRWALTRPLVSLARRLKNRITVPAAAMTQGAHHV